MRLETDSRPSLPFLMVCSLVITLSYCKRWCGSLFNVLVFSCVFFVGGLFIFSIRCDSYDPVEYGYSATCEKLEKSGKWKLILKEKRELHSTPNEERYRYCYLITYQVLQ